MGTSMVAMDTMWPQVERIHPEQDSPFAEDKRVTLPGDKPGEGGGEVSNYTNHNTVNS